MVIISPFAGFEGPPPELQDFCLEISKTSLISLTVCTVGQTFVCGWNKSKYHYLVPSFSFEPHPMADVLGPLNVLRNLKALNFV